MKSIKVPKYKFKQMKKELKILKDSNLYKRLLEFKININNGRKYN